MNEKTINPVTIYVHLLDCMVVTALICHLEMSLLNALAFLNATCAWNWISKGMYNYISL